MFSTKIRFPDLPPSGGVAQSLMAPVVGKPLFMGVIHVPLVQGCRNHTLHGETITDHDLGMPKRGPEGYNMRGIGIYLISGDALRTFVG
jgi:hypothetical protein